MAKKSKIMRGEMFTDFLKDHFLEIIFFLFVIIFFVGQMLPGIMSWVGGFADYPTKGGAGTD